MGISPDREQAMQETAELIRLVRTILERVRPGYALPGDEDLTYPGFVAFTYAAQRFARIAKTGQDPRELDERARQVNHGARLSAGRARRCRCRSWPVDLTGPEAHLRESLVRALAALPGTPGTPPAPAPGGPDRPAPVDIGEWREDEREVFCAAGCLLAEVWPQMLAEVSLVVRQVALLAGRHIDGYTDFTTHGVAFINRRRLEPGRTGLPGSARLAEALVHEGTHNRFNVAALSRPFLIDEVGQGAPALLATPLRSDPRPLSGLFQQLVVLVRCVSLYDRLLPSDAFDTSERQVLEMRRDVLRGQADQALATIQSQADALTGYGQDLVAQAGDLLSQARRSIPAA
jgi:HEXXH motif-containing protein